MSMMSARECKQEFWKRHLAAWEGSDETQTAYCQNHELSLASFHYWKRMLKKRRQPAAGQLRFVPITVAEVKSTHIDDSGKEKRKSGIQIVRGQFQVDIDPSFDADTLTSVLTVLGGL